MPPYGACIPVLSCFGSAEVWPIRLVVEQEATYSCFIKLGVAMYVCMYIYIQCKLQYTRVKP